MHNERQKGKTKMKTLEEIINGMYNRLRAEIWEDFRQHFATAFKDFRRMGWTDTQIINRFIDVLGGEDK